MRNISILVDFDKQKTPEAISSLLEGVKQPHKIVKIWPFLQKRAN